MFEYTVLPNALCSTQTHALFRRSIPQRWFSIRFWAADTIRNMVAHRPPLARTLLQEDAISAFETLTNPQLDHELSADPSQLSRRRQPQAHSVPPVAPIPTSPTAESSFGGSSFPISSSPQHSSTLPPPSPPVERRPSVSTVFSDVPITPPASTSDRRFLVFQTRRPSHSSVQAEDRRVTPSTSRLEFPKPPTQPNTRRPPSLIPTPAQERLLEDYKVEAIKRAEELTVYVRKWTEWTPNSLPMVEVPRLEALSAGMGWLSDWEAGGWTDGS